MQTVHVVTNFLEHDNKILLLRRSQKVGSYRQRWAGISGHIEKDQTPLDQAWQEIAEEAGLFKDDLTLLKEGIPLEVIDEKLGRVWVVHPFRFALPCPEKVTIDWEHTEFKWIYPHEIKDHECVPCLYEAWLRIE